jgi:alkylation response protein AidB-like acyl-CoA dehydrogenase
MAFVLSEEQTMLRDMAAQFFAEQVPTANLRQLRDADDALGYDPAIWQQIVELGFAGILIPEDFGGTGFGATGMGIVMQQAGRTLAASPLFATSCLGAGMIMEIGREEQKQELLPQVADGSLLLAVAIDESSHHNPSLIACTASKNGDAYVLNGQKTFVLDGHIAQKLIVIAREDGAKDATGLMAFLVDANTAGVTITRTKMVDSRNAANITFDNVALSADDMLGNGTASRESIEKVLDLGRIIIAAEMLGGVEMVFETTLDYLKERKQFGQIIGSFQALQHRAAEMFCEVEIAQAVVQDGLTAIEENRNDVPQAASLAKARLGDTARLVTNEGVQMHGGIGMTDAVDVGLYIKRARVQAQILGDSTFHTSRYASLGSY